MAGGNPFAEQDNKLTSSLISHQPAPSLSKGLTLSSFASPRHVTFKVDGKLPHSNGKEGSIGSMTGQHATFGADQPPVSIMKQQNV